MSIDERATGVGGSDAPAVLGVSPWRTPYDVYAEKIGEALPLRVSEPMIWGTLLEPVIAAEWAARTGLDLETPPLLRHPTHDWLIGHIDRRVTTDPRRIVEIKCARSTQGWGESGTDEIPLQYLVQVHHYLVLAGAEICDVVVLIGGNDLRHYQVRADDEIARELIRHEHSFWHRVEHREPPDPVNVRDALRRWGWMTAAGTVTAGEAELYAVERLRQIRQAQKDLDTEEDEAKLTIMSRLGEAGDRLVDQTGTLLCTWRLDNGRREYVVPAKPPSRRFLLKD